MSRAVPLSGRAAITISSTTQNAVKPSAERAHHYLKNLRLRTSTVHADTTGSRAGSVDRSRSDSIAYLRLKPKSFIHARAASTATAVRVDEEEHMHDWYDWNHNYQLPTYVDSYIPYAFSSEGSRARSNVIPVAPDVRKTQENFTGDSQRTEMKMPMEQSSAVDMQASTSQLPETSWDRLSAALRLDIKAGSAALVDCVKQDGSAILFAADSHANNTEWQAILARSRAALHHHRSIERPAIAKSSHRDTATSDTTTVVRMLQVMGSVRHDTPKACRLLYRLLVEISSSKISRLVLPQLPSIVQGLTKRETTSDLLATLTPLFGKRHGFAWELPPGLRRTIGGLGQSVGDPIAWLHHQLDKVKTMPHSAKRRALQSGIAEMSLFFTLSHGLRWTIRKLLDEVQRSGIPLSQSALATSSARLAALGDDEESAAVYSMIDLQAEHDTATTKTIVRALLKLGRQSEATSLLAEKSVRIDTKLFLDILGHTVDCGEHDVAMRMVSSNLPRLSDAMAGRPSETALTKPERQVLKRLFSAFTTAGETEHADGILRVMMAHKIPLHTAHFNRLMKAYAVHSDMDAVQRVFGLIRQQSLSPDLVTYSTVMTMCAHRKDPTAARRTFEEMEKQGILPDAIAYAILLNAYIDVGDWIEASQFWQRLPLDIQADRNISNTLLKGMVVLCAPFHEVYRVFLLAFPDINHADLIAWTILIQSACDSGNLSRARELYQDFKLRTKQNGTSLHLDHFLASILVVGHIRYNEIGMAKRLHREMQQLGVKDTSVTYAVIIDGALRGRWPMTAAKAKELGFRLLAESEALQREPHKGRGRPVENIVVPLIQSAIRDGDVEEVEHLFAITLEKETQPSVLLHSMLMDAYRHAGEHDRVQQVWDAIRNLVEEQEANTEYPNSRHGRLRIPLSIYIDAMSEANRLEDILRVWTELRVGGFGFDSHNWNHLAVALLRNREVLKAFDIVENVLIKRQEEIDSREYVGIRPEAAHREHLSFDLSISGNSTALQEHLLLDPAHRPPNRRHEHRDDAVSYRALRLERMPKADQLAPSAGLNFDPNVFEKWRPTDAMWRPAYFTMASLDRMYAELEHGRSSMFALMAEEEEEGEFGGETDGDISPSRTGQSAPPALLAKINSKYAKTVSLIMLHRRKKADRALIRKKAVTSTSDIA